MSSHVPPYSSASTRWYSAKYRYTRPAFNTRYLCVCISECTVMIWGGVVSTTLVRCSGDCFHYHKTNPLELVRQGKTKLTVAFPRNPRVEIRPMSHQQQWTRVAASSKLHPETPPSEKKYNKIMHFPERHSLHARMRTLCNKLTLTLFSHSCRLFSALTHTGELLLSLGVGIFSPESWETQWRILAFNLSLLEDPFN